MKEAVAGVGAPAPENRKLLRFLLLLLTDADLEVQNFGFLERLVIVACHGVRNILIDVGILGQDGHQREIIVAGRAEGPEPLHIRNCHRLSQCSTYENRPGGPGGSVLTATAIEN